jgi:hypothetical protein
MTPIKAPSAVVVRSMRILLGVIIANLRMVLH